MAGVLLLGSPPVVPAAGWSDLRIGGGGFVTGISMAIDGTKVVRTDTYNGYVIAPGGTTWRALMTVANMPAGTFTINTATGLYEVAIAPSESTRIYIYFDGNVYKSTDAGVTWGTTGYSTVAAGSNSGNRSMGRFMAVDPQNADILYVGTPNSGVFKTTNGGTSFAKVTAVGDSTSGKNSLIAFDPSSSVSGGAKQGIIISTYGAGVYKSTDGGANWSLLNSSGMPTTHTHLVVDQNGVIWLVDDPFAVTQGNLNKYSGGAWSVPAANPTNNVHAVAVDPANSNKMVVISSISAIIYSTDAFASVANSLQFDVTINGDQTWRAQSHANNPSFAFGDIQFDPAGSSDLWMTAGFGVVHGNPALSSNSITLTSIVTGIEQTVGISIMAAPGGTSVLCGSEDFPLAYKAAGTFDTNLAAIRPSYMPADTLAIGWGFDWAPDNPSIIYGLMAGGLIESFGSDYSGISTNGGDTWTAFGAIPPTVSNGGGGNIAVGSATNAVIIHQGTAVPYYTTNSGASWTASTGLSTLLAVNTIISRVLAADKVNAGTYYAFKAFDGFYKSTNSGASWSKISNNLENNHEGFSTVFKSSPYVAGDVWWSAGQFGAGHPVADAWLWRSTNALGSFSKVTGFREVMAMGFGAQVPGHSYPAILVAGWYKANDSPGVDDLGLWESRDDGVTWTDIGPFPGGNPQFIHDIDGDKVTLGKWYIAIDGSSFKYYTP